MTRIHYLYCIVPAGHAPPAGLRGLEDAEVTALGAGDLSVWASGHDRSPRTATEAIRVHHAVNEAALTDAITPVPLRFGQMLREEAQLAALLETEAGRWRALLAEFAGCVEYGVRVLDPALSQSPADEPAAEDSSAGPGASPGRRHMAALAARARVRDHARPMLAVIREETAPLVRHERVDPLHTPHGVATIAHLVERTVAPAYGEGIRRAAERQPALRFLFSGPWPPYSFVT